MNEWMKIGRSFIRTSSIISFYEFDDRIIIKSSGEEEFIVENSEENISLLIQLLGINQSDNFVDIESWCEEW